MTFGAAYLTLVIAALAVFAGTLIYGIRLTNPAGTSNIVRTPGQAAPAAYREAA